jgi:hypothetical protein
MPSVLSENQPWDAGQKWSGCSPEEAVRDLIFFLDCSLEATEKCHHRSDLVSQRFKWVNQSQLNNDSRELFRDVRRVLMCNGLQSNQTISTQRLDDFYDLAFPLGTRTELPFVVKWNGTNYSWFVAIGPSNEHRSCLCYNDSLRFAVLADQAFYPFPHCATTPQYGTCGPSLEEWQQIKELNRIEELVTYIQTKVRKNKETKMLLRKDQETFERAVRQVLATHSVPNLSSDSVLDRVLDRKVATPAPTPMATETPSFLSWEEDDTAPTDWYLKKE